MASNSIRTSLSPSDVISDILLSKYQKNLFLIVEGIEDILFFRSFIDVDVEVLESHNGKTGVHDIISHFNTDPTIIGICDADYDPTTLNQQIFHYDYNCLEMMLASFDTVFSKLSSVYYFGTLESSNLRNLIFNDLLVLSCTRKLNAVNNWALNFKGLSFYNVFDSNTGCIDSTRLFSEINRLNSFSNFIFQPSTQLLINFEFSQTRDFFDLLSITRGHDFIEYFNLKCSVCDSPISAKFNPSVIIRSLIIAFSLSDFYTTALFKEIKKYETDCHLNFLKT